jgi:hypothetical protein
MSLQMRPKMAFDPNNVDRIVDNLFIICTSFPNHYAFEISYQQQSKRCESMALKLSEMLQGLKLEPSP